VCNCAVVGRVGAGNFQWAAFCGPQQPGDLRTHWNAADYCRNANAGDCDLEQTEGTIDEH